MMEQAQHINCNDIEFIDSLSQSELSNIVYSKIKSLTPFSSIELPDRSIIVPQINLPFPVTIKGSSGSIIELINGNVICDFTDFIATHFKGISLIDHPQFRVKIQQVSIIFKFDVEKITSKLDNYPQVLSYSEMSLQYFKANPFYLPFIVVEPQTPVQISDCYFRSIKRDKPKSKNHSLL